MAHGNGTSWLGVTGSVYSGAALARGNAPHGTRLLSSAGQSNALVMRRSSVRIRQGAPLKPQVGCLLAWGFVVSACGGAGRGHEQLVHASHGVLGQVGSTFHIPPCPAVARAQAPVVGETGHRPLDDPAAPWSFAGFEVLTGDAYSDSPPSEPYARPRGEAAQTRALDTTLAYRVAAELHRRGVRDATRVRTRNGRFASVDLKSPSHPLPASNN